MAAGPVEAAGRQRVEQVVDGLDTGLHSVEGVVGADITRSQAGDHVPCAQPDQVVDHGMAACQPWTDIEELGLTSRLRLNVLMSIGRPV